MQDSSDSLVKDRSKFLLLFDFSRNQEQLGSLGRTLKPGADDGVVPANVFDRVRTAVIAGSAKLVDDVKKSAPPAN